MARFIVTHRMAAGSQDEFVARAKQVAASPVGGAQWLNSWWAAEEEKMLCEWEAPDAESVRASLEPAQDLFPIVTISEVEWINPQWYR